MLFRLNRFIFVNENEIQCIPQLIMIAFKGYAPYKLMFGFVASNTCNNGIGPGTNQAAKTFNDVCRYLKWPLSGKGPRNSF